jgi:chemotaxis protein CheC
MAEKDKGLYEDILREICSFGAGNAAARLSKMVGKKVRIDLPEVWISRPAEGFPFLPKERREVVIGINSTFGGDRRGVIFIIISLKEVKKFLGFVLNKEIKEIKEMEESALLEICNILSGAIVGSIANFAKMRIILNPPKMPIDFPHTIIDLAIEEQMESIKWAFFTIVTIRIEIEKISVLLAFFPFFDLVGEVWKKMEEGKLP